MEQSAVNKDEDSCEQRIEYTFLTPVATIDEEELILHQNTYHFCYVDPMAATPPTDDENFENCSSDGSSQKDDKKDPFSPDCKIPIPGLYGNTNFFDSTTFIRRRNERERARVRNVNDGFERLRQHLPLSTSLKDKRLSKVETLRFAITYINHLQSLLNSKPNLSENK